MKGILRAVERSSDRILRTLLPEVEAGACVSDYFLPCGCFFGYGSCGSPACHHWRLDCFGDCGGVVTCDCHSC